MLEKLENISFCLNPKRFAYCGLTKKMGKYFFLFKWFFSCFKSNDVRNAANACGKGGDI